MIYSSESRKKECMKVRTALVLCRNGIIEDPADIESEHKIEEAVTKHIYDHEEIFGKRSIRGFGEQCAKELVSMYPNTLIYKGKGYISTKKGEEFLQKKKQIDSWLKSKEKSKCWHGYIPIRIPPCKSGTYYVMVHRPPNERYREGWINFFPGHDFYVTFDQYDEKNGFSLDVIAWQSIPEPNYYTIIDDWRKIKNI